MVMMAITMSSSMRVNRLRDFAFGEQGASPLHPDRQGAGAGYEAVDRQWRARSAVGEDSQ